MLKAWTKNGNLATYKGGILYAELTTLQNCCCDCSTEKAIKERQQAYGITAAWSGADPTNTARLIDDTGSYSYSATNLRNYVNAIAPAYVNGSYPASATYLPPMLTSSYATGATDSAAVKRRVYTMLQTKHTPAFQNGPVGQGIGSNADRLIAESDADISYASIGNAPALEAFKTRSYDAFSGLWTARAQANRARVNVSSVPLFPGAFVLYGKPRKYNNNSAAQFDKQGYAVADYGYFGILQTMATAITAASRWFDNALSNTTPPPLPTTWTTSATNYQQTGFEIRVSGANTGCFALATWDFECF